MLNIVSATRDLRAPSQNVHLILVVKSLFNQEEYIGHRENDLQEANIPSVGDS